MHYLSHPSGRKVHQCFEFFGGIVSTFSIINAIPKSNIGSVTKQYKTNYLSACFTARPGAVEPAAMRSWLGTTYVSFSAWRHPGETSTEDGDSMHQWPEKQ